MTSYESMLAYVYNLQLKITLLFLSLKLLSSCMAETDLGCFFHPCGHPWRNYCPSGRGPLGGQYCHFSCQLTLLHSLYYCCEGSSRIQVKLLEAQQVAVSLCSLIWLNHMIQFWGPNAIIIWHANTLNPLFAVCISQSSGEGSFQECSGGLCQSH